MILAEVRARGLKLPEVTSATPGDPSASATGAMVNAAAAQLRGGIPYPEIEANLVDRGLDAKQAASMVSALVKARRESGRAAMRRGAFWCIGGTAVTAFTFLAAAPGGTYVVTWGAIVFGAIQFFRGMAAANAPEHRAEDVLPAANADAPEARSPLEIEPRKPMPVFWKVTLAFVVLLVGLRVVWVLVHEGI